MNTTLAPTSTARSIKRVIHITPINKTIKQKRLRGSRALNCLLSLFGRAIAILGSHQRAPAIDTDEGPVMSGVAILGLAAVTVLLGVNIAIAVAVVVLDKR